MKYKLVKDNIEIEKELEDGFFIGSEKFGNEKGVKKLFQIGEDGMLYSNKVDIGTFEKISNGFLKDKNNVYKNGFPVRFSKDADVNSVKILNENFLKVGNLIYHGDGSYMSLIKANSDSFETIKDHFGKDKNGLWHRNTFFEKIGDKVFDTDKFEVLGNNYVKFDNKIYYFRWRGISEVFELKGVGIDSFEIFDFPKNHDFAGDQDNVYRGKEILCAREKFRHLFEEFYTIDNEIRFYFETKNLPDLDTFEKIDGIYYKDKDRVYARSYIDVAGHDHIVDLPNSDPQTFEVLGYKFGADKNSVYLYELKLEGSDPETFEKIVPELETENYHYLKHYFYKDKNNVYFIHTNEDGESEGFTILKGIDPESFEIIDSKTCKDKNATWKFFDMHVQPSWKSSVEIRKL